MNDVPRVSPPWRADRDDGTYRNPVLFADYSDPDAIRVGDDYWLTASSFSHVPGLPILHSRDLVNWDLVNHALPRLEPEAHFLVPRHGNGVWAPAIRHQAGRFWIYYPDPDFGIFVVTAADPRNGWSAPIRVCGGDGRLGRIDPCPFWDDDGRVYLIHAWSRSRAAISNRLTLHELTPDGAAAADEGEIIIDGDRMPGWHTIEGPKLYKRAGYYYIFAPAGGVPQGYQAVFRSRRIRGPYEARIVLHQGRTAINGPHQGAWVDTPGGEHWFLHFQDRGPYGRVVHLQPMAWRDGWPVMGAQPEDGGPGEPVLVHSKPALPARAVSAPPCSDEFDAEAPGLQWQWQANPRREWISLRARRGWLRLNAVPVAPTDNLWLAPNLLLQKFPAPAFAATTRIEFASATVGAAAGLIVFGYSHAWIGLRRTADGFRIVHQVCTDAHEGGSAVTFEAPDRPASPCLDLRVDVDSNARCAFSYRCDGTEFRRLGDVFLATPSKWVGAKVGLFATAPVGMTSQSHADFNWFHLEGPA